MSIKTAIEISGEDLTYKDIVAIGIGDKKVALEKNSLERCKASRAFLEKAVKEKKIIYGVSTSYGPMCNKIINDRDM